MHKRKLAFPAASPKTVVFTLFLTGSCRDFIYGVKDDIGNQMGLQTLLLQQKSISSPGKSKY